ncbi:MAG: acyl-CoA dehydrogenase family protein [Chloroflexi bacterium]|nr:acyl-CoA dehydrogenase family protein [Chloroflexota bacterium]
MQSPVGGAIGVHGSAEQQARLLGDSDGYCVAFSEAAHGSDLAAVETRGEIVRDQIVVTGTKVWLARADTSSAALVLCQTEPDHGLSCVLVPLQANSVDLRPIREMTGHADYWEVTFDAAIAPLDNLIGGRGHGLQVAMTTLTFGRSSQVTSTGQVSPTSLTDTGSPPEDLESEYWALVTTARRCGRTLDPLIRQQLAAAYAQLRILQLQPHAATTPILWSQYRQQLGNIALEVLGANALLRPDAEAYATSYWQHVWLSAPGEALANGTADIQRTLLAEHVLDLPT